MKFIRHTIEYAFLALLIYSLAACTTTAAEPQSIEEMMTDRGFRMGEPVERIRNFRLDGWNYVDRRHLILSAGPSGRYLVFLRNDCHGLPSNELVAFTTTTGQLTTFDHFLVQDGNRILESCFIESISKLERQPREPA